MTPDDPLLTAVAEALREHGVTDPQAVLAAAGAAERILGRDRCIHSRAVHNEHHLTVVDGCPWCTKTGPSKSTATVPTGSLL